MIRLFSILIVLLAAPAAVWGNGYTVAPPIIERDVVARDIISESIKVTNTSDAPIKLFPSVHVIALGDDGHIMDFESPMMTDRTRNIASWIEVSRARVELAPGETIRIPVTFSINPQAVPGQYYALIGFGSGDKRDEAEQRVTNGQAPGVTIRLSIADTTTETLRLNRFVAERFVVGGETEMIQYELENYGDTAVTPAGEIIFYNVRGEEVATAPINSENVTLAAKEVRRFTVAMPELAGIGRHKAFLNVVYGSNQRATIYDTTFFTVVPLPWLVAVFIGLLAVTLLLTLWYIKRTQRAPVHDDDDAVALYVRTGTISTQNDHDIDLKVKNAPQSPE